MTAAETTATPREGRRALARTVSRLVSWRSARLVALLVVVVVLGCTQPALAQDGATNPVCSDSSGTLPDMIEGFVQITTALGLMGLLVVWQADSLLEMFTFNREQKAAIKQHKRGALRSAGVLVILGPLFTVAGSAMNLPIASCVDLIPF